MKIAIVVLAGMLLVAGIGWLVVSEILSQAPPHALNQLL
jgi:hypothetical protein